MQDLSPTEQFELDHVRPRAGRTLIVGSQVYGSKEDRRLRYEDPVGVDMLAGPGVDLVADLEEWQPGLGEFDHVECFSVLEHSRRPWLLAQTIERLMRPGATLHLSVPFVWRFHDYGGDYYRFTRDGVRALFPHIEWTKLLVASDRLRDDDKLPAVKGGAHPYMARAEVVGFGAMV